MGGRHRKVIDNSTDWEGAGWINISRASRAWNLACLLPCTLSYDCIREAVKEACEAIADYELRELIAPMTVDIQNGN